MKKLSILLIFVLIFTSGCDLFSGKTTDNTDQDVVEEKDPVVEEEIVEEEPETMEAELPVGELSPEAVLAKCMTENGAKLYTASWCGHCKNQKAAFKDGLEYLDNTECAEGEGWSQVCEDAGVTSVPTWIFADGSKKSGNTPLADLALLTECEY